MKVVLFGAWTRDEKADVPLVNAVLNDLKKRYAHLIIITAGCDRGVGKIVKARCMPENMQARAGEFDFIEVALKIYVRDLSKTEMAGLYIARDATIAEIGEEFHIFLDRTGRGIAQDLLDRVAPSGRPFAIYYPGETLPQLALPNLLKGE